MTATTGFSDQRPGDCDAGCCNEDPHVGTRDFLLFIVSASLMLRRNALVMGDLVQHAEPSVGQALPRLTAIRSGLQPPPASHCKQSVCFGWNALSQLYTSLTTSAAGTALEQEKGEYPVVSLISSTEASSKPFLVNNLSAASMSPHARHLFALLSRESFPCVHFALVLNTYIDLRFGHHMRISI
jgi:hypothetical protein